MNETVTYFQEVAVPFWQQGSFWFFIAFNLTALAASGFIGWIISRIAPPKEEGK